jgi:hypothetical protein
MNSVYIKSAPCFLQSARKGGSLTSSMGASNNGNSPNSISLIFTTATKIFFFKQSVSKIDGLLNIRNEKMKIICAVEQK